MSLTFYKVSERTPKHGQEIMLLMTDEYVSHDYSELTKGIVEYNWIVEDDEGEDVTEQIGEAPSESCYLQMMINDTNIHGADFWAPLEEFDRLVQL